MTNNFSTIKNNQTSEKFYLIRIIPRRAVNDDSISLGGGIYKCTFPFFPESVKANTTLLTRVTTVVNPYEYSYNELTEELIYYATPSSSNIIVVSYYLFYTGGRHRVVTQDPENTATPLRDWSPTIKSNPEIVMSIQNVVQGTLSISLSSLSLINEDQNFYNYLTDNDSFNKCEAKVWVCLNSAENIQKIYDGRVSSLSVTDDVVNIEFEDPFGELLSTTYLGDTPDECYFNTNDFPNMYSASIGLPIYYIIGKASRYKTIPESIATLTTAEKLDPSILYDAVCTNFTTNVSNITNRNWGLCRVSSDGLLGFGFTPSNINNTDPNFTRLDGTFAQIDKFIIGDTFEITQAMVSYYVRVLYVDRVNNYLYVTKEGAITTGAFVNPNSVPSIIVTNNSDEVYYCLYKRDYTETITTTSGGNKFISITFVNNFEANHIGMPILEPGVYDVRYRVRPDTTSAKHGSVIKMLLERAGLTVDSASITAANLALTSNCAFSIPTFDEGDYGRYIDYVQSILASTLSYITLANDFEIEYHLIQAPSSTEEVTDIDILEDSTSISIDYQDLAHQVIAYNPHWSSSEGVLTSSATVSSLKTKYLHNITNADRFVHVLEDITSRISAIAGVRGSRKSIYSFDTKVINLDNILGDDILLERRGILGGLTSKQLKIISISKSPSKTSLIATDLLGI